MDFIRTDGRNKDFIENCRLLDIDLDRRVGKKIKRDKYKKYNQLDEISEAIPAETIECFIKYCHRETISIDETNVVFLNHLSKIYKVATLEKYTDEYISDHSEELSIIILNLFNEKNEKIATKYEGIVSSQFLKFIDDERLLNLGIASLYRILSKYEFQRRMKNNEKFVKSDNEDETELKIESFLFKCIHFDLLRI